MSFSWNKQQKSLQTLNIASLNIDARHQEEDPVCQNANQTT